MSTSIGVQALVRRTHEDRVVQVLREHGALTRAELATHIGLSRTTLSDITASLLSRGVISAIGPMGPAVGRGRPAERLRLDPAAGHYIGVDFRRSMVCVAVANAARELIATDTVAYDGAACWESRIEAAFDLIAAMSAAHGIHVDDARGVAVGVPSPLSSRAPQDQAAPGSDAHGAGTHPVRASFERRFGVDVLLDNNTRLAALAEAAWPTTEGVDHLLYLRVSSGIGGGLVVDGRLVGGSGGLAGEFGHVTVAGEHTPCRCGKSGCLETVASIDAILTRCRQAGVPVADLGGVRKAVEAGDATVLSVIRSAGEAVGQVLGALALSLNPAQIVVGGEVAAISEVFLSQVAETVSYELRPVGQGGPQIRPTRLGDEGGAVGGIVALLRRTPLLSGYPLQPDAVARNLAS